MSGIPLSCPMAVSHLAALKAYAPQIKWAVTCSHDGQLPTMQTDIVLPSGDFWKALMINAKYYAISMQIKAPHMTQTVHSNNSIRFLPTPRTGPLPLTRVWRGCCCTPERTMRSSRTMFIREAGIRSSQRRWTWIMISSISQKSWTRLPLGSGYQPSDCVCWFYADGIPC